jgi:hypothetical protein
VFDVELELTTKFKEVGIEKLSQVHQKCFKTKTKITIFTFGTLADLHVIKKYENIHGGIVIFDTKYHAIKIIVDPNLPYGHVFDGVKALHYTEGAFVAIRRRDKIISFGFKNYGGEGPEISDVVDIASTSRSFAARRKNGDVHTWGDQNFGSMDGLQLKNIKHVVGTYNAFAALNEDGKIKTWSAEGDDKCAELKILSKVEHLTSISGSFAVLDTRGNVFTWLPTYTKSEMRDKKSNSSTITFRKSFGMVKIGCGFVAWGDDIEPRMVKFENIKKLISTGIEFGALTNDHQFFAWNNNIDTKMKINDEIQDVEVKFNGFVLARGNNTFRFV